MGTDLLADYLIQGHPFREHKGILIISTLHVISSNPLKGISNPVQIDRKGIPFEISLAALIDSDRYLSRTSCL